MAKGNRPRKKSKSSGGFVTIRLGPEEISQDLQVHEDIIKTKSEYFRTAFDAKWEEGKTHTIELPEDDIETVEAYIDWLYDGAVMKDIAEGAGKPFSRISRLYVLGEKIQDDAFCDAVMETFIAACQPEGAANATWYPIRDFVTIIYDGTPPNSPARRFMVYAHQNHGRAEWLNGDAESYHPDFLLDLSRAFLHSRPQPKGRIEVEDGSWLKLK